MPKKSFSYQTINSIQFYLNSANADIYNNSTYKSNVVFCFRNNLKIDNNAIELRASVVDAQIPVSWYLINATNNKFYITINGTKTLYYFTQGNYNVNSFITQWNNDIGTGWTITFNNNTNKFQFQYTQAFSFSDDINSLFPIIGFINGNTYSSILNSITSSFSINFAGITKVNIKSSTFMLKNVDSYKKSSSRILASIPVNASNSGVIYYNNYTQYKSIFCPSCDVNNFYIELVDDFGNYINFNNIDWTITIQIDIVCEVIHDFNALHDYYENLTNNVNNLL